MKILVRDGEQKVIPTGFSFTVLFFGVFVPLFRGDGMGVLIQIVLAFFTAGLSWIVVPFTYNNAYEQRLRDKGWKSLNNDNY
jgi:hypothetical protein